MFNRSNFLPLLKGLITSQSNGGSDGVGFIRSHDVPIHALKTAAGLTLTAATNPLTAAFETNSQGIQWAAGNAATACFNFTVPYDYDEVTDKLVISLIVNSAGNTDAPTLSAVVYSKRVGTALSADLAPAASAAIPKSATAATAAAERTITITGKALKANDVLTIQLAPGTHATDAVNLYGMSIRHRSTLVAFTESLR